MRSKVVLSVAALAVMAALPGVVGATTFMSDSFSYPDGELTIYDGTGANVSGGAWEPHSGTGFPTSIDVVSGEAVLHQGNPASEDANRRAVYGGNQVMDLGDKWYFAAVVKVEDERADPNASLINEYFMHFKDSANGFRGRAYVGNPADSNAGDFTFGLSTTSGGQQAAWGTDLSFGQQYKIVVSYEYNTGITNLWVNPVNEASLSISDLNAGGAATAIESLALRQAFNSGAGTNYKVLVDSVALGDDFDTVFMNSMNGSNIPEPASMALALMGLAGIGYSRRRR